MFFYNEYFESPFGTVEVTADEHVITTVQFTKSPKEPVASELTTECCDQLKQYFEGKLTHFDLPMDWSSYTNFYQQVWSELMKIPFGETRSYQDLANNLQNPKAVRAVGMANGKNPIAIIVPCHRVIGSNGSLTGYAHGVDIKQQLLALENPKEYGVQKQLF